MEKQSLLRVNSIKYLEISINSLEQNGKNTVLQQSKDMKENQSIRGQVFRTYFTR